MHLPIYSMGHPAHGVLFGWPAVFVLGVASMTLPTPEAIATFLIALGTGLGTGAGMGYAAFQRYRIKSMKELDEAQKDSLSFKLGEAITQVERNKVEVAELRGDVGRLRLELETEQQFNNELRKELLDVAQRVLEMKEHIKPRTDISPEHA